MFKRLWQFIIGHRVLLTASSLSLLPFAFTGAGDNTNQIFSLVPIVMVTVPIVVIIGIIAWLTRAILRGELEENIKIAYAMPVVLILLVAGLLVNIFGSGLVINTISETSAVAPGIGSDGWVSDNHSWSYNSADSPTFVVRVTADETTTIGLGMRVGLTQTTAKYFIVTAVSTFSGGHTDITMYGGTDYTLANAAIAAPKYSPVKAPFGFPLDRNKWKVEVIETGQPVRFNGGVVVGTWYNPNVADDGGPGIILTVPIGVWRLGYSASPYGEASSTGSIGVASTLSTANNSASDADMTGFGYSIATAQEQLAVPVFKEKTVAITAKQNYYLNAAVLRAIAADLIGFYGGSDGAGNCRVWAIIDYL